MINWNHSRYLRNNVTQELFTAVYFEEEAEFITQSSRQIIPVNHYLLKKALVNENQYEVYSSEYIKSNFSFV